MDARMQGASEGGGGWSVPETLRGETCRLLTFGGARIRLNDADPRESGLPRELVGRDRTDHDGDRWHGLEVDDLRSLLRIFSNWAAATCSAACERPTYSASYSTLCVHGGDDDPLPAVPYEDFRRAQR